MTRALVSEKFKAEAMVAPVFLAQFVAEAAHRNIDLRPVFQGLAIEAVDLDAPGAMISHHEAITVVRRALPLLSIEERGLDIGRRTRITERGALALGLLAAHSLGDAIRLSLHYAQSAGYLLHVREAATGGVHQLIAEPFIGDQDVRDFLVDLTFAATVELHRQVTGTRCNPSSVEFVRGAPPNAVAYESFFRCPVRFECLHNVLCTPARQLAFPLPWANTMAYALASKLLEREFEQLNRQSALGQTVERALRRRLPRSASLSEIAASLHLSERTLRRQLADAGLSYRTLLDGSRQSRAFDLMNGGRRSIAHVAEQTGFSDARAFARAFKRWTGQSPSRIKGRLARTGLGSPLPLE